MESALPAPHGGHTPPPELRGYAVAWRREFRAKWRLCTALQHAIRHPLLAEWLVSRLGRRPDLAALLTPAVGDLIPAQELRPFALLARLLGVPPPLHALAEGVR